MQILAPIDPPIPHCCAEHTGFSRISQMVVWRSQAILTIVSAATLGAIFQNRSASPGVTNSR